MVDGYPAALQNISAPKSVVGTERDHVAPWRSVYKIHQFMDTDVTFVLTRGGHNAGIVSEPGHRQFRVALKRTADRYPRPDEWAASAPLKDGSWWVDWAQWLAGHTDAVRIAPPTMGTAIKSYAPIVEAPGAYVSRR